MKTISSSILFLVFVTLLSFNNAKAQVAIGGFVGGGYISGDSPNITSFSTSVFIDTHFGINDIIYPRLSFIYTGDFDNLLPGTRYNYFPFMKGISLKGMVQQDYTDKYFLEEGVGIIYLNDRTFVTTNSWSPGLVLSVTGGIDLTKENKGMNVGVGAEYAFGFGGTFPKYFSLHLQLRYVL